MAGCYGPLSGIYCINESADSMPVFRASVKKFFSAGPQGVEPHALSHAYSRPPSVIPAEAGTQGVSKTGPDSVLKSPRNAPGVHSNLHEPCTKRALAVRFEDFTHPTKLHKTLQDRQPAKERRHSRARGNPVVVKTGPNSARKDALEPPGMHRDCIQICTKRALIVHRRCVSKTPRHPTGQTTQNRQPSTERLGSRLRGNDDGGEDRTGAIAFEPPSTTAGSAGHPTFSLPAHFPDHEFTEAPPFGRSHKYRLI